MQAAFDNQRIWTKKLEAALAVVLERPNVTAHVVMDTVFDLALGIGASDIHVEPMEETVRLRLRVDGFLINLVVLPAIWKDRLVARVKIMSNLDIAEKRIPQDGRANITWNGDDVDLRIATMPVIYGEKIVIRLLLQNSFLRRLTDLGLSPVDEKKLQCMIHRTSGIILFCGATGSGKTTSLYASLQELNHEAINIVSIEDPVEYRISGITQTQINPKAGLYFSNGLRAILRQDPNVIMIGEIRDKETANIALQAALTGHLVLSTIHAKSVAGVPLRLIDMGIEPYLVATALLGVVSQRLLRKLCSCCKKKVNVDEGIVMPPLNISLPQHYESVGCVQCHGTGYAGRTAVYEFMENSPAVSRAIYEQQPAEELERLAAIDGTMALWTGAAEKVQSGVTSLAEARRILQE